jgi:hypothetical protein
MKNLPHNSTLLRDQIVEEIAQDDVLRQYFTHCCRIEVEPGGASRYHVHLYFDAYGKHYGEMWVGDEADWKKETAKIRQEVGEERGEI